MSSSTQRGPRRRGRPWLLALGGLIAGLMAGRAAPPAAAGSYPESGRPVYLGMGGATFGGGSVDAATGAALMKVNFGSILSYGHFPVAAGFLWKGQDNSPGPFGPGTFMLYDWFLQYDGGDFRELVGPGNRRFEFNVPSGGDWIDTRDPEMLGAVLHIPPPAYGAQKIITWKNGWKWYFDGYGSNGLVTVVDPHGVTIISWISRDANTGQSSQIMLSSAYANRYRYIKFNYVWPNPLVQSVTISYDAGGGGSPNRTWTLAYDGSSRLSSITDPLSGVTRFTWDTYTRDDGQVLPRLKTVMTPRGNLATPQYVALANDYDAQGRVIKQTHADGGFHTVAYPAHIGDTGTTVVTDQSGNATAWGCVWEPPAAGHKEGYHLANYTDALGRTTQWDQLHAGSFLDTRITDYRAASPTSPGTMPGAT